MTISKPLIGLLVAVIFTTPLHADDSKHLDDTVAAGIVFKLAYLFGCEGTWSTLETANPESFQSAMTLISKDLSHFSDTERGILLRKEGEQLISFLSKAVRLTSEAPDEEKPDIEAEKFLRDIGLDPKKAEPAKLVQILTHRIAAYAKQSNTPTWVYDRTKREQGGAGQPATRSESK